ncbi:serine protease [Lentzea sp. NBRC 102530]|uniref:S1 family peptidase n=1 Tax=Lentzea sp. NBRC 102530 TaxID=3032201 RepID=UPI0024A4D88C|nr:serine protease [Lentzea sp. NBRC 102530]GLY51637.1 hypothetical protein Lesp01_52930 [Lentzea sp. NBRC 102530]
MPGDERIPPYLGRILTDSEAPVGTCFQVAPGVLVTAQHVLRGLRAGGVGSFVGVDALAGDQPVLPAEVVAIDEQRDLAVLHRQAPLAGTVEAVSPTDVVTPGTKIVVTGVARIDDPEHSYKFVATTGEWRGAVTRNDVPQGYFTSDSVAPGMSGAPVRRAADDVVIGVVSARYNSDNWLKHSVWTARVEDFLPLVPGDRRLKTAGQPKARVSRRAAALLTIAALLLTVSATAGVVQISRQPVSTATPAPPAATTTTPVAVHKGVQPMPTDAPVVTVMGTERVQRRSGGASAFTVPTKIEMTDAQVATFAEVLDNTKEQVSWYDRNGGVPIGFGLTKVTLMGRDSVPVRITDIEVIKECASPIAGTYFSGFTQGSPSGVVQLGFDLDEPSPTVQEMVLLDKTIPDLIGESYFAEKSIELRPGEQQDLVLAALTKTRHCKFSLRLIIAAATGSYSLDIDDNGKPFEVSGMATPTAQEVPLSGYQAAYVRSYNNWSRVDPRTYRS